MNFVTEKTYKDLVEQIDKNKMEPWKLRNNLCVHPIINSLFNFNNFIHSIFFDEGFNILKDVSREDGSLGIGEIPGSYFDHYYGVEFEDTFDIGIPEIIAGVMNFPYITEESIKKFIINAPANWEVYVINPVLMNYGSAIGLFLTPKYYNGVLINDLNNYIQLRTGYPLFLWYVFDNPDDVAPIKYEEIDLNVDDFIKRFNYTGNKGLEVMLNFWKETNTVECSSFSSSFKDYLNNQSFSIYRNINLKVIKSHVPFKITLTESDVILGGFKKFHLDCAYMLADTDSVQLLLWDDEMQALIDGEYTIELINTEEYRMLRKLMINSNEERRKEHDALFANYHFDPNLRPNKVQY